MKLDECFDVQLTLWTCTYLQPIPSESHLLIAYTGNKSVSLQTSRYTCSVEITSMVLHTRTHMRAVKKAFNPVDILPTHDEITCLGGNNNNGGATDVMKVSQEKKKKKKKKDSEDTAHEGESSRSRVHASEHGSNGTASLVAASPQSSSSSARSFHPAHQISTPTHAHPSAVLTGGAASEDVNDMVYKALMDHKKAEVQRIKTMASDTRTITEAMMKKTVCLPKP